MIKVNGMSISLKQELENIFKPKRKVYRFISEMTGEQCEAVQDTMTSKLSQIKDLIKNMWFMFLYKHHLTKRILKNDFGRREEW